MPTQERVFDEETGNYKFVDCKEKFSLTNASLNKLPQAPSPDNSGMSSTNFIN